MPYASKAQRGLFHVMAARGEMPAKMVAEWDRASKGKKLPDHVRSKPNPHVRKKGWK